MNSDFDALRIKTEDGSAITAENVRDEPQPAQLFEVPSGFRKFDPQPHSADQTKRCMIRRKAGPGSLVSLALLHSTSPLVAALSGHRHFSIRASAFGATD
jgi:hypothetical protein